MRKIASSSGLLCCAVLIALGRCAAIAADPAAEPAIVNSDDYEACGATSLFVVLRMLLKEATYREILDAVDSDGDTISSFADLKRVAANHGLEAAGIRLPSEQSRLLSAPAIIQVKPFGRTVPAGDVLHFAVYLGQDADGLVSVLDAPKPPLRFRPESFAQYWTGEALMFFESPQERNAALNKLDRELARTSPHRTVVLGMMFVLAAGCAIVWWPVLWGCRWMNRRQILAGGALMTGLLASSGCGREIAGERAGSGAKLELKEVELGVLKPMQEAVVKVPVRNTGRRELKIGNVVPSCACSVPEWSTEIAPGGDGSIQLTIQVVSPGPGSTRLMVYSNADNSPTALYVRWFGEHQPQLSPRTVELRVPSGQPVKTQIGVLFPSGSGGQPLEVVSYSVDDERLRMTMDPGPPQTVYNRNADSANQIVMISEQVFRLEGALGDAEGDVRTRCRFVVRQAGVEHQLEAPVIVRLLPEIQILPRQVSFVAADETALVGAKRAVLVQSPETLDQFEIGDCPAWLTWRVSDQDPNADASSHRRLEFEIGTTPSAGRHEVTFRATSAAGVEKSFKVPVVVAIPIRAGVDDSEI